MLSLLLTVLLPAAAEGSSGGPALALSPSATSPGARPSSPQSPSPQSGAQSQQDSEASTSALQARIDSLKADESIAAELKTALLEVYGKALESAKAAEAQRTARRRWLDAAGQAPDTLAKRRAELEQLDGKKPGPPREGLPLPELEQGLARAQQTQTTAASQAAEFEKERARRAERRAAAPALQSDLEKRLGQLPAQPATTPDTDPRLQNARRLALLAERAALSTELEALQAELQAFVAEEDLLRVELDLATRKQAAAKADAEAWQSAVQQRRAEDARTAAAEAQRQALLADPRLAGLAERNAELARQAQALTRLLEQAEREKSDRKTELTRLQQDFAEVKKRVDVVGETESVGAMLRKRRAQLNQTNRSTLQLSRSRRERISEAQLQSFEFDERRTRIVEDPDAWLLEELGGAVASAPFPAPLLEEARRLREARIKLLSQLRDGYDSLTRTLVDVESNDKEFARQIAEYREYVTAHVLGIRSSEPLWKLDVGATALGLAWLADARSWAGAGATLLEGLLTDVWPIALLLPVLIAFALRPWLRRRLAAHGDRALRGNNVSYVPTALAATDTLLLAAPVPLLLWILAWRLAAHTEGVDFGKAIAAGILRAAPTLLLVAALSALVRAKGLAEAHFRWQTTTLTLLRRNLPLLIAAVPFSFGVGAIEASGEDRWLGSLGALMLGAQLALLVVAFWRLFHPRTGVVAGGLRTASTLYRFRRLWFFLAVATPSTLLTMVALGYEYTALQLATRLQLTATVLLIGVIVHAMILRGLVLERRRLQMRQAQERLAATRAGEQPAPGSEAAHAADLDPQSLAQQTQALLHGAVTVLVVLLTFQIWIDELPALGILRRFELWEYESGAELVSITLADLLLSVFVLAAAVAAARNLPALLELLVLQRLQMKPGERHAVTTLAKYGIMIVGVMMAFGAIGIGWSKVQWLIAAISLGLGFGLQEIFANFVSGLILLLERPIRVGDTVTVGSVTGKVMRIRIRATTIQDWDRKELVVPNREFVTSHFVNWTLTDSVVRWVFPVGVAYGSDTEKALRLLDRVASESPHVLKEPKHEAVFVGFGDSTLKLNLRLFVDMSKLDWRWMTDLYQQIDNAYREAGIEIAFPQRDVNLKLEPAVLDALRRVEPRETTLGSTG